ncbi:MAG: S-layer homology domain-containing protein [Clostridia bacterium]
MKKRIISLLTTMVMLCAFVPVICAAEINYDEYLQLLYSDLTNDKIYDNYALYDIDDNDIPELIFFSSKARERHLLYTYVNGYCRSCGELNGYRYGLYSYSGDGILGFYSAATWEHAVHIYLDNDQIIEADEYLYADKEKGEYYCEGQSITKEQYYELFNDMQEIEWHEKTDLQYFYDTIKDDITENTNSLSTITYGEASVTGIIEIEEWEHANGTLMTDYILKLDTPINVQTQSNLYTNIDEIQFWISDLDKEYIGKHVKVDGYIRGQAGTIYYRRNVVIENAQISILEEDEENIYNYEQSNTERGFDITRDGWPFPNAAEGFKYGLWDLGGVEIKIGPTDKQVQIPFYQIPAERWIEVYGQKIRPFIKDFSGNWGGNCFGMCALAYKIYNNEIPWDRGGEVNENGYDTINIVDSNLNKLPSLQSDSELCKQIERYQIAQQSLEYIRTNYQKDTYREMFEYVLPMIMGQRKTLSLSVHWDGSGHRLLVDTSRPIEDRENNWKRIYLYDPNNPYYDNNENLNLPDYYSQWDKRYIEYNTQTGEWYMTVGVNSSAPGTQLHKEPNAKFNTNDNVWLRFEDFDTLPNNFDNTLSFKKDGRIYIGSSNILIKNTSGETVFKMQDGEIIKNNYLFNDIVSEVSDDTDLYYYGYIDTDLSEYVVELEHGAIVSMEDDSINAVKCTKKTEIQVNQNKDKNTIMSKDINNDIIILTEKMDDEEYEAKTLYGGLDKNEYITVEYDDEQLNETTNTENLFNIEYENNDTVLKAENINLSTWDGTYDTTETDMYSSSINNTPPYSDISSTDSYFNAVNLLSALDIINGYEDSTFKPNNKVTRAEFTKLVITMLGGTFKSEAETSTGLDTKFSDVPGKHWASGYITSGVNNGLIDGMGDGTFAPDANVTYAQAMKILACSAGYSQLSEDAGGWPDGYLKYANEIGIGEGVKESNDTAITRGQVAQMIFNTIQAPVVIIKDLNSKDSDGNRIPTLEKKDGTGENYQSILTKLHEVYTVGGYITEDNKFTVTASINFEDEYYPMDSEKVLENVNIPENYKDTAGVPVTAFIKSDEDSYKLIYMY